MEKDLFLPGSCAAAGAVPRVGTHGAILTEGRVLVVVEWRCVFCENPLASENVHNLKGYDWRVELVSWNGHALSLKNLSVQLPTLHPESPMQ